MILKLLVLLIVSLCVWMGWKFYQGMDWDETPEPSPDLRQMHKKEAELLHLQELLSAARDEGKISPALLEEFNRYCDSEIQQLKAIETAWQNRRSRHAGGS